MRNWNRLPQLLLAASVVLSACDSSEKPAADVAGSGEQAVQRGGEKNPPVEGVGRSSVPKLTPKAGQGKVSGKGDLPPRHSDQASTKAPTTARERWEVPRRPASQADEMFLLATDDAGRIAAIDEKQSSGPEDLAPILRRALLTSSPEVRVQAVMATAVLGKKEAIDILAGAAADENSEVRHAAIERASERSPEVKEEVFEEIVEEGEHDDTRELVFRELAFRPTKGTIELLMAGLDDESPEVRRIANHSVRRDLQQEFGSTAEGLAWWTENQGNYDEHLQLVR